MIEDIISLTAGMRATHFAVRNRDYQRHSVNLALYAQRPRAGLLM